jgi:hypothetical protein
MRPSVRLETLKDYGLAPRPQRVLLAEQRRRVPASVHGAIRNRAGGQWLLTRLIADVILNDPAIDAAQLPSTMDETYATLLDQVQTTGASNPTFPRCSGSWRSRDKARRDGSGQAQGS